MGKPLKCINSDQCVLILRCVGNKNPKSQKLEISRKSRIDELPQLWSEERLRPSDKLLIKEIPTTKKYN